MANHLIVLFLKSYETFRVDLVIMYVQDNKITEFVLIPLNRYIDVEPFIFISRYSSNI